MRDSEFKVRSCSGGEGGTHFALARRCSAQRRHLCKRRKPKVAVNAGRKRLKLGAGGTRDANRRGRTDARSNSNTELMTKNAHNPPCELLSWTSWRMRPSAARQRRFVPGEVSLRSPSTQECVLTISTHDARAKSRYAPLRPKGKGEPSLCSASTQECILTISTCDASPKSRYTPLPPKGRPHNPHLQSKRKPLLHSASTQESILTISAHHPRSKSPYAPL